MRSMVGLVTNEWLKMSKKRSFFVAYALIAAAIALMLYVLHAFAPAGEGMFLPDIMTIVLSKNGIGQMVVVLAIIGTAGSVAKEHSLGTIKLLLIRSQTRSSILASKYITVLLYTLTLCLFTLVCGWIGGGMVFGFDLQGHAFGGFLESMLYLWIYAVVFATLSFLVGILTRSTGATIGIGMFLLMMESLVVTLLSRYDIVKYLIFTNADLSVYTSGNPPFEGMTLAFSSTVIAAYLILFLAAGFIVFQKRDVA